MTKKDKEKLITLGAILVSEVAIEVLRVGAFKRGLRIVTGRDVSWRQAVWTTVMLRASGSLFEEGRENRVRHDESIQKIKTKHGIKT